MARDRKRAKQRQQQRRPRQGAGAAPPTDRSKIGLHRADVPGALEHASGEVDEFDAALIRGAHGLPVEENDSPDAPVEVERNGDHERSLPGAEELVPAAVAEGSPASATAVPARDGAGNGAAATAAAEAFGEDAAAPAHRERRQSLPRRAISFLRASWAELQRVQWPDRPQVSQATAVVLGFVAVAGAYLGAADWVAQKIVNFIL